MNTDRSERRRSKRYQVQLRALFQRKGTTHFLEAETDDISAHGVFVRTKRRPLDIGTPLTILFKPEGSEKEIMVPGVVVRIKTAESPDDSRESQGMGIEFGEMDEESREALLQMLQRFEEAE